MTDQDRIAAAQAASHAMKHLGPAFEAVEAVYAARLTDVAATEPWATDKIKALAFALKVSQSVKAHISAIIGGGDIASANDAYRKQIEALSPERKRVLGISVKS